jgi:hypothetical protein
MTRRAEVAPLAGKCQPLLASEVGTPDAGKPAVQITAIKIAVNDILHKWSEESVLTTEALIIDVFERFKNIFNTLDSTKMFAGCAADSDLNAQITRLHPLLPLRKKTNKCYVWCTIKKGRCFLLFQAERSARVSSACAFALFMICFYFILIEESTYPRVERLECPVRL